MNIGLAYKLNIKESSLGGFGVFAGEDIPSNTIIENCLTIRIPKTEINQKSLLQDYVFYHTDSDDDALIALGNCSLYNHQDNNNENAEWNIHYNEKSNRDILEVKSIKPIKKGEEITWDYGEYNWQNINKK